MSLKEKFSRHTLERERRRSVAIPEFDEVIYYTPINLAEWERIVKFSRNSLASNAILIVIEKAEDAEGNKIFSMEDVEMLGKMDPDIVQRIANEIFTASFPERGPKALDKIPFA